MTVVLIKIKSCNALLHMLVVCNSIYISSVLKYTFLILGPLSGHCMYVSNDMRIHGHFPKPKVFHEQTSLENAAISD